jgi:hypothetical protein
MDPRIRIHTNVMDPQHGFLSWTKRIGNCRKFLPKHMNTAAIFSRVSDPDPYSESGSGSRRAKMTHKKRNSCLDGLFSELQASITWAYFMEA